MVKLIDSFVFFNELNMLKFRLTELDSIVDTFILVEADKTHSGLPKPYYFEENKQDFAKFLHKIHHVKVTLPESNDTWVKEKFQRNSIADCLVDLKLDRSDIVIVSDLDEICDINSLKTFKEKGINDIYSLPQDFYYYNLNTLNVNSWTLGKIFNYGSFVDKNDNLSQIRVNKQYKLLPLKCGWHFSYFGDVKFIINKIKSFAHQECNKDKYLNEDKIKELIKNNKDLYFRDHEHYKYISLKDNFYLPVNYMMLVTNET